ncbi:putative ribosome assembly protein 3 protein [Rosellinia necatrix]|uniref:Ribosome assembly protein 3 n=1 Tax=Rosellinia necatrix TaxID=77044 RepID=A0A1S7UV58_ROSNE|nr:putative ribosome assembly protein 3 protein [Rosellinia necatrix]
MASRSTKTAGEDQETAADFTSYYLQQSTKEFAEDLDKIRGADDFKGDALPMLVRSLQQGTSMFSAADQKRIVDARRHQQQQKQKQAGDGATENETERDDGDSDKGSTNAVNTDLNA